MTTGSENPPVLLDQAGAVVQTQPVIQTPGVPAILDSLRTQGFQDVSVQAPYRAVINLQGFEKTGKTHFPFTGPGPCIYFNIDVGSEGVLEKFKAAGQDIIEYKVRFKSDTGGGDAEQQALWMQQWLELKAKIGQAYQTLSQIGQGTVILDTWTEAYELCRLAHFGKIGAQPHQYGVIYADLRTIVREAYDVYVNTVFCHKMGLNFNTREPEMKGFGDMNYLCQINLRTFRLDNPGAPPVFGAHVLDCRREPQMNGMELRSDNNTWDLNYVLWLMHTYYNQPALGAV